MVWSWRPDESAMICNWRAAEGDRSKQGEVGDCPGERMVGARGHVLSPDRGRLMEEGPVVHVVEGGAAAAAMGWRGCFGAGDRCPFGDSSLGLRGTARTGEYRVGGGTDRCRLGVVVVAVVVLSVAAVVTGRGLRGGNREACGRDSGGGGAEEPDMEDGGLSRSEGGMVSAPGGGGLSVRLCNI